MKKDDPGKLLRLFRAINLLSSSKRGYTAFELAEKLGVTYRTVYRDFIIFQKTGFELITDDKHHRYRLAKTEEVSEKLSFSAQEADVLRQSLLLAGGNIQVNFLIEKIQALSESALKVNLVVKNAASRHINVIAEAIRNREQILLQDYHSARSQSISDRFVEPFAFSDNGASVQCYEITSKQNKFFKIERIAAIKNLSRPWQHAHLHHEQEEDIFGISITTPTTIHLRMGMLSASLMKEEFAASASYITQINDQTFELITKVQGYKAVGRFVLGLIDDIQVLSPPELNDYLKTILSNVKL
jgi:predicted DNA-binding transcriptional regulator YafY